MQVKVYSTPTCPWCVMAKKYLDSKNVSYLNVDVSKDMEQARELVSKTGQRGVPVIEINGHYVIGFDKEKIDQYLMQ